GRVSSLAFNPDGRYVLTSGLTGERVNIWDVEAGKKHVLEAPPVYLPTQAMGLVVRSTSQVNLNTLADVDGKVFFRDLESATGYFDGTILVRPANLARKARGARLLADRGKRSELGFDDRSPPSLLYESADFTNDPRLFTDLVSYAPGLN